MLMCLVLVIYRSLTEVMETIENVYALLFVRFGLSSLFLGFISNYTLSVRGKVGDDISQRFISFFPLQSGTSPLENVRFPLDDKDITFLLFYLVGFLYMVCSLSEIQAEISRGVVQTPAPVVEKSEWRTGCRRT